MENKQQSSHIASPTVLLVSVRTTSWQDGHRVTAAAWARLSTCPRERQTVTGLIHSHMNKCMADTVTCVFKLTWERADGARLVHRPSLLQRCVLLWWLVMRQHADPPMGCLRFRKSVTHGPLTWFETWAVWTRCYRCFHLCLYVKKRTVCFKSKQGRVRWQCPWLCFFSSFLSRSSSSSLRTASSSHSLSLSSLVTDEPTYREDRFYTGEVDLKQAHVSVNHFLLLR